MTVPHRTVLLLAVGFAVGPAPACYLVGGKAPPMVPAATAVQESNAARAEKFAVLPSRPGEVVPIYPAAKSAASTPPAAQLPRELPAMPVAAPTEPVAPSAPAGPIENASRRLKPELDAPQPTGDLTAVRAEPNPLPLFGGPPVVDPPILAALRAYVENRAGDAIRHLQALDKPNQDFALALMPLLVRGTQMNAATADPNEVAVMAEQLQSVAAGFEAKAALRVDKVAFCRRASGFGRYEPWPEAQPYRPNDLALLYVEMRHVGSEPGVGPNGEGFVSRAVVCLEVRDAHGRLIEQTDPTNWRLRVPVAQFEHTDYTRSPLRDYSRTYRISVPTQPGVYTITVVVRDPTGSRTARSQPAQFQVAGP